MVLALILIPVCAGLVAFVLPGAKARRALLIATALAHSGLTGWCWRSAPAPVLGGWLSLDAAGLLFLSVTSVLFLTAVFYAVGYLAEEANKHTLDIEEGFLFDNAAETVFVGCLLLFLGAMTLVTVSRHFGLLWVGIEATTLASAPLIYFHKHHRSLEATWKYLLVCSVGIALALLANFFLGVAASPHGEAPSLAVSDLVARAGDLQVSWLKAAFLLFVVGYGTKMGLAPLHTWLPDAHSESPSVVSALLSGAVLNCAFLGLIRVQQVCVAAGLGEFGRGVWIALGMVSLVVGAVFIVGQTDYKRLLAYSSVEHMGLVAVGIGFGGAGVLGALFHAINHSLAKAMLFLVSGNILARFQTKAISRVRGLRRVAPWAGLLWVAGFLAITGMPPSGAFLSKFLILKSAFDAGHAVLGMLVLGLLGVIFVGMTTVFLGMVQGEADKSRSAPRRERWWQVAPPALLGVLVLCLGVAMPEPLSALLRQISLTLGGGL